MCQAIENVNGISYDLTVDIVIDENGNELTEYELQSGEIVFVRSSERISMPTNLMGRIAEKNSRMLHFKMRRNMWD